MYKFDTHSFLEKTSGLGETASRLFNSVFRHPAFGHMFKGTNLDPSSGLLGNALQSMERSGVTDQQARQLLDVVTQITRSLNSLDASHGCRSIPENIVEILNEIHNDTGLMRMSVDVPAENQIILDLFDYRMPQFSRLYDAYIMKHSDPIGNVDKKKRQFAGKCLSILFRSTLDLYRRVQATTGSAPGSDRDICL
jgi:hypothetical protein